jgi:glutathione synthase/RimK-type ligase-like ATP-grasp enzyme
VTPERAALTERLAAAERRLAAGADDADALFDRAHLLDALGEIEAARTGYLEVLKRDSQHRDALNEFGRLLDRTGFRSAARTAFQRAVETHPNDAASHGNLALVLLDLGDTTGATFHFETAVRLDPRNLAAHQCLAMLRLREGDQLGAKRHGRVGFRNGATAWPYRGEAAPIRVLMLHSALGGNVPFDRYLGDRTFAKWTLVAEFFDPAAALPAHALVVNAIGDASRCRVALDAADALLANVRAPVVNAPRQVATTTREANAAVFGAVPNVVAPRTVAFARAAIAGPDAAERLAAAGFTWPLIVRAPGFHTGEHCVLVATPDDLAAAVAALPGEELLAIQYLDVRDSDGLVRKYRAMFVDGAIYPLHLAIAHDWMVHYFRAEMHVEEHRAEEAAYLADPAGVLGAEAWAALEAIAVRLGLDYGGIDFALDRERRIVAFEANATMFVPPPSEEAFPYRRAAVARIDTAVRAMLLARSR